MRAFLAVITARWFVTLIGALLLCALIWFFGHLLAIGEMRPLDTDFQRLLAILVIAVLWGISNLWAQRRAAKANDQMVREVAAAPPPKPGQSEVEELGSKLDDALQLLKKRRFKTQFGNAYLYELPWYLMIGPPGSGKTTAIAQSGLDFPLESDGEIKGVGGTRNCEWVFTEEAVLIDTAGRYTTQDSDQAADHGAWTGFLDLLRKHRKRQPINGVLVAMSVPDILTGSDQLLAQHARAIRQRLNELETHLQVKFPVYLLVTKSDLLAGFDAFFADLGEHERDQVWGMTFADQTSAGASAFSGEWDLLLQRVTERTLERLQDERDLAKRAAIFSFEGELATLGERLHRLVEQTFRASQYDAPINLRGVYLTSGTQEGTPIDRLVRSITGTFGIQAVPPRASRGNRSYFITDLLRQVIFREASLVSGNPAQERRDRLIRYGGWTAAGLALVAGTAAWAWSYSANQGRIVQFGTGLGAYARAIGPAAKQQIEAVDDDLRSLVEPLRLVRDLPGGIEDDIEARPWSEGLGLSQDDKLEAGAQVAYERALGRVLLPRLLVRMEARIWANINNPDYVLESLKAYLMLGGQQQLDAEHVAAIVDQLDWQESFAREPQVHGELVGHLESLMQVLPELEQIPELDSAMIEQARVTLRQIPLAERAYDEMMSSPGVRDLPEWLPLDHAGPGAAQVLTRRSGRALNAGIPGAFTYDEFHATILPLLPDAAAGVAVEGWVLGSSADNALEERQLAQLQDDILKLYYRDYIEIWELFLRDVTLQPIPADLRAAAAQLKPLADTTNSPLKLVLQAALGETKLTVPPPEPEGEGEGAGVDTKKAAKLGLKALGKVGAKAKKFAKLVKAGSGGAGGAEPEPPGRPVEEHFAQWLAPTVEGVGGAPGTLDTALTSLTILQQQLQDISLSPNPDQALAQQGGLAAVAGPVVAQAQALPEPLGPMLAGVAETLESAGNAGVRRQLNAVWRADVLPFCQQALAGRFPFERASGTDVALADFGRLLGPGGLIDQFTANQLASYVDTASRPWRWQVELGIPNSALAAFEQARGIRDSLFAGGTTPQASFSLEPISLDAQSSRVALDLDGQQVVYNHGPTQPAGMQWPGPGGTNVVRLSFTPLGGSAPVAVAKQGTWSLFRLLQEAEFQRLDRPDLFNVTFRLGAHYASFRLQANSVANPFDLGRLSSFRCPGQI